MIQLQHITKRFGPVAALSDVSLEIPPRAVLGLLGENGAGKSTLMNILFGMLKPDAGTILAAGREVRIRSPRAATALGIGMVHQHFKLVPTLTALENCSLFLRQRVGRLRVPASTWLERLRWTLPLDVRAESLTVGQQQRTEILKALLAIHQAGGGKITSPTLILDEPTAVLTPQETAELFTAIRSLRDAGTAVVFISHKLDEVRRICDQIAILRRGKLVHAGPLAEMSSDSIAEKMIGSRIEMPHLAPVDSPRTQGSPPISSARADSPAQLVLLALRDIATDQLKSITFDLHPGEILGIAGVDGNGQSHLVQTILNMRPCKAGHMEIASTDASTLSTRERLDRIAFIAEDRQREALVLPLSIEDNLLLKDYRNGKFNTLSWLRFRAWRSHAKDLIQQFDIRASSPTAIAGQLSGGNQQKVVLARELYSNAKPIVVAVNPTRGLDVGATAFVLQKLLEARRRGAGVLLIHPDLDELLAISDRVAVLYNGRLTLTQWPNTTKEAIGRLMLGLAATEAA